MKIDDLQAYVDAWNEHDIDKIMSFMSIDCIYETGGGTEVHGTRHSGYETVKSRFISVLETMPDISFDNAKHFIKDDRGCSEWIFTATKPDGTKIELEGCDLFTFHKGKIKVKSSFMKHRH
ncbi:nuclear transport factor 2 family protein [Shewanella sp. D64]|uniref:nuclear transport factor 2 family protein n=1 Tax=unclassified Shewanella TaxID=196818 RepID=UPI0022BA6B6F|nr:MULTISPECIES: nuclear transport factor 2 family protein [unclassified Shewanella]MEC4726975.1 nuclear transport factor 2 family protein [Shewanella sp. D64]MEC4738528.1 nuclear transport factor 2 family protein [Shewanella sp. E94]WBJ93747.1 nuclear transport factor 2 family protein [Shewanella sp. MTB7]